MSGAITTAVVVGAGVGAVGAVASANIQAKSAKSSADTQAKASKAASEAEATSTDKNLAFQREQAAKAEELQRPWREAGLKALDQYSSAPEFSFSYDDFTADPSYEFRKTEAINALDKSAASRGRLLSGGQDRAITRYSSDLASEEYNNAYSRSFNEYQTRQNELLNIANMGTNATNQTQLSQGQFANTYSNTLAQSGAAQAGYIQNTGNAIAQGQLASGQATASAYQGIGDSVNKGIGNYTLYNIMKNTPARYEQSASFIGPQRY